MNLVFATLHNHALEAGQGMCVCRAILQVVYGPLHGESARPRISNYNDSISETAVQIFRVRPDH